MKCSQVDLRYRLGVGLILAILLLTLLRQALVAEPRIEVSLASLVVVFVGILLCRLTAGQQGPGAD
ncbi:hypothetical protein [Marinobacterium arenosum]|uniref:hypothetical protein n=1 Tax=Marinobacterium arenosum TaxID=2862496 RepID=UPI001C939B16|nr:hypothetical protein [Marinobacterium arenosum]MBY4675131.1 hypothetical protein [Marinobacterium arenosum]